MLRHATILFILVLISGVTADYIGVKEEDKSIIRNERDVVTLRCFYESTSRDIMLYWFRQHSKGAPHFLLYKGAKAFTRFKSSPADTRLKSVTNDTSTALTIAAVNFSDSALYYCALGGAHVLGGGGAYYGRSRGKKK
uniref:Ig-like domain-containing protein n=1 Tax=Astyanax mexicanus TaxID=7994 RepID=A0A8B9RMK0_ASTMX